MEGTAGENESGLALTGPNAREKGFTGSNAREKGFTGTSAREKGFTGTSAREKGFTGSNARDKGFIGTDAHRGNVLLGNGGNGGNPHCVSSDSHATSGFSSTECINSSTEFMSVFSSEGFELDTCNRTNGTDVIKCSTETYCCELDSQAIIQLLKTHPAFQKIIATASNAEILAATLIAAAAIGSGTYMYVVFEGVISSIGYAVATAGAKSLVVVVNPNTQFTWAAFSASYLEAGVALLTMGAGFLAGDIVGLALYCDPAVAAAEGAWKLTETQLKVVGTIAGALAGSTVRVGSYVVITTCSNEEITGVRLVVEGVYGAILGGKYGYLGVKASTFGQVFEIAPREPSDEASFLPVDSEIFQDARELLYPIDEAVVDEMGSFVQTPVLLVENLHLSWSGIGQEFMLRLNRVVVHVGFHLGNHKGSGLVHIFNEHADVFQLLFGYNAEDISLGQAGDSDILRKAAFDIAGVIGTSPVGYVRRQREIAHVFQVGERFVRMGFSSQIWGVGGQVLIQANIVGSNSFTRFT